MLEKINFYNYKAFDSAEFDLKPINLILGANSSGKSSLVLFPLLFKQTVQASNSFSNGSHKDTVFSFQGQYVNNWSALSILKNKKHDEESRFEIDFSDKFLYEEILVNLKKEIQYEVYETLKSFIYINYLDTNYFDSSEKSQNEFIKLLEDENVLEIVENKEMSVNDNDFIKRFLNTFKRLRQITATTANRNEVLQRLFLERYNIDTNKIVHKSFYGENDIKAALSIIKNLSSLEPNKNFKYGFQLRYNNKTNSLELTKADISYGNKILFGINSTSPDNYQGNSSLDETGIFQTYSLKKILNIPALITSIVKKPKASDSLPLTVKTFHKLAYVFLTRLENEFKESKLNYIGPLRDYPQKYYTKLGKSIPISDDFYSGTTIAKELSDKNLREKVNHYLKVFKTNLTVESIKEDIHSIGIIQNGINIGLNITEIGFGISQILPIIVKGLIAEENSIMIIEQPEVHLHPNAQADIGELLKDIVKDETRPGRKLIIETHSEYLVKRIRTLIIKGELTKDDVGLYFVSIDEKNNSVFEFHDISEKGEFKWPKDFHYNEIIDTLNFLSNL